LNISILKIIKYKYLFLVVFLFFIPRNKGVAYNILLWAFLLIGVGLQSCFYFMEAYARKSCPANVKLFLYENKIICCFFFKGYFLG